ncbi:MAG: nucleotidyltransferase family protein [Deltaproteobacteria bacterium]|nr:nucleotidyltransferase family protein [Deltaproteobacteria bacterium]
MMIRKAMLLAAGFGTRLKPLTDTTPKPLLPLDGHRLIDYPLTFLKRSGIENIMINLHHLGSQIREYVGDGKRYELTVHYSEEAQILGTGGGIKKAGVFFGNDPFIVMNSDSLMEGNVQVIIDHHDSSQADATLVVRRLSPGDPYNSVARDEQGFVLGFGNGDVFYTGLMVMGPKLLKILPPADRPSCLVKDGFLPLLKAGGRITTFLHEGYWNDVGTPERYEQAKRDVAEGNLRLIKE